MATAARQAIDDLTIEHYHAAMRDEADADTWDAFTFKASKDGEFRDVTGEVWFPKLAPLREAYARSRVLPFVRPPLMREPWQTDDDHDEYLSAARSNPKGRNEGPIAYIVRIAETVAAGRLAPVAKAMPWTRDPGQEG